MAASSSSAVRFGRDWAGVCACVFTWESWLGVCSICELSLSAGETDRPFSSFRRFVESGAIEIMDRKLVEFLKMYKFLLLATTVQNSHWEKKVEQI